MRAMVQINCAEQSLSNRANHFYSDVKFKLQMFH